MSGATVRMPMNISVDYPRGSSIDSAGRIQLESDAAMVGGIAPDIRIPRTLENIRAQWEQHRDLVLERGLVAVMAAAARR
jgi:hypothetical protein